MGFTVLAPSSSSRNPSVFFSKQNTKPLARGPLIEINCQLFENIKKGKADEDKFLDRPPKTMRVCTNIAQVLIKRY